MANDSQKNDYKLFYQVYPGHIETNIRAFPIKSSYKCKYAFHDPRQVNEIDIASVLRKSRTPRYILFSSLRLQKPYDT